MRIHDGVADAAEAVDSVLRRLMPAPDGVLSYAKVARACGCSSRTPRSWLRDDDGEEITVPRSSTREKLLELVRGTLSTHAADTLARAWGELLNDDAPADAEADAPSLDSGDGSASSTGAADANQLSLADQQLIAEQAHLVLSEAYAHLTFKQALHAVNPVQRLRLLQKRLRAPDATAMNELDFHREMLSVFTSMRDRHTSYILPSRYRNSVAVLPFRVEQYFEKDADGEHQAVYIATKVDESVVGTDSGFEEGVLLSHWNGVPIGRAIELLAEKQAAGNDAAAFARALDAMTLRPMLSTMAPDEEWVDVTFLGAEGEDEHRFVWAYNNAPKDLLSDHLSVALGIDAETDAVSVVRKEMYGRKEGRKPAWSVAAEASGSLDEPIALHESHTETHMPWSFRAHTAKAEGGRTEYGYIRIFNFKTKKPEEFIDEFGRLASVLPQRGLIIDVRGNGGGSIVAAEGCLQVLAKRDLEPSRAQFPTSPLMLDVCRKHAEPGGRFGLALQPWVRSMDQAVQTGAQYSVGFPITPQTVLDSVTHRYPGSVVLIVDALCYSATDMFAAGFVDHAIGSVVGIAENTGAGGGNVWRHSDLVRLMGTDDRLAKLPHGIDFRFAVRRTTRVLRHEGEVLEDLGIDVTERHYMSQKDLMNRNQDLITFAADQLKKAKSPRSTPRPQATPVRPPTHLASGGGARRRGPR